MRHQKFEVLTEVASSARRPHKRGRRGGYQRRPRSTDNADATGGADRAHQIVEDAKGLAFMLLAGRIDPSRPRPPVAISFPGADQ
jgi:hypothetical protein